MMSRSYFMRFFLLVICFGLASGPARAAALERDLGGGLIYYRAKNVPANLPPLTATGTARRAYVLDLRYAQADAGAADTLVAWLKTRASPRTPVFVLANSETPAALLAVLSRHDPKDGMLLLGSPSPGFSPDIAVKTTPDAERRAYDAFETQSDPLALLRENSAKVRNDEARLAREHLPAPTDDTAGENPPAAEDKVTPPPAPATPPVDYVLQRAFHLHRGLLALKKL